MEEKEEHSNFALDSSMKQNEALAGYWVLFFRLWEGRITLFNSAKIDDLECS